MNRITAALLIVSGLMVERATPAPAAGLRPDPLFSDHVVLQRDAPLPVWGTADPGTTVTVVLSGATATAEADSTGHWEVRLPPQAAGGPFTMTIAGDGSRLVLHDVLIGEVWLCSGQSNMEFAVRDAKGGAAEIPRARHPGIRQFLVPHRSELEPIESAAAEWVPCSPQTVERFTAVGYWFARELTDSLGVAVGLLNASVGGTMIERWISRSALESDSLLRFIVEDSDARTRAFQAARVRYEEQVRAVLADSTKNRKLRRFQQRTPIPPKQDFFPPSTLYNGMIAPLVPMAIRGVIWYQGEQNAGRPDLYRHLFPTLIESWRATWNQAACPFLFVQLANYEPEPDEPGPGRWAELREAQAEALDLPATGMVVALDVGESHDIHPKDKATVGRRLARLALSQVYGRTGLRARSPRFASLLIETGRARVQLVDAEPGLVAHGGVAKGFLVAGADGRFVPARARIDGTSLLVWSPSVKEPVAVRYGWADDPPVNVYTTDGRPLAPFRSDRPTPEH